MHLSVTLGCQYGSFGLLDVRQALHDEFLIHRGVAGAILVFSVGASSAVVGLGNVDWGEVHSL